MPLPLGLLGLGFGHVRISRRRKLVALLIAGTADLLQTVLFPLFIQGALSPFDWAIDIATAAALLVTVGLKACLGPVIRGVIKHLDGNLRRLGHGAFKGIERVSCFPAYQQLLVPLSEINLPDVSRVLLLWKLYWHKHLTELNYS